MMRRARFYFIGGAVAAVLLGWLAASSPATFAETDSRQEMAAVVVDSDSVREAEQAVPLAMSFMGLMATQQAGREVVFIDSDRPGEPIGPFSASDSDFADSRSEIAARLGAERPFTAQTVLEALEEARSTLSAYGAPAGSSIYVALGGAGDLGYEELSFTVEPLLDRIVEQGWTIHGLNLAASDRDAAQFLNTISRSTGGTVFSLSSSTDLKTLAEHAFGFGADGPVQEIVSKSLVDTAWSSSDIAIMPGTEETTLYLFKEGSAGAFHLINPSSEAVSDDALSASAIIETEHLVIRRIKNPAPGNWSVETSGVEGNISIWNHSTNRYDLVLRTVSPMPIGESASIMAYAAQDGRTVVLEGVEMFAKIAEPNSSVMEYELFDDGTRGDSTAGDGYYMTYIPSFEAAGSYGVTLEMLWPEHDHRITSDHTIEAQPFPSFHVETMSVRDLQPGEARNIGTVSIHLDGGPYAVSPEEIEVTLAANAGNPGALELVPHRLYGDGPAWQYDMVFTPSEYGIHTLQFSLSLEYAGRTYSEPSNSIAISTVPPVSQPVSIVPAVVEAKPAPAAAAAPVGSAAPAVQAAPVVAVVPAGASVVTAPAGSQVPVSGVTASRPAPASLPWMVIAALVAVAIPIAAGTMYFLTRPKPYGYIYTEGEDEVVDFSNLERRPVFRFFYRGLIRGSELNIPGFEGLVFHFMKDRIDVKSFGEHPTVRVNNQPLIDSATIGDKTWIGTGGKLYTFLNSPIPPAEPAGAD